MRRPLIAGNWKMNLTRAEAVELARGIVAAAAQPLEVDLLVCPPFVYLEAVAQIVQGTAVGLGAQNMCERGNGAFTGEISAAMLRDVGCQYVILGHSERRQLFGETNEGVLKKTQAALAADLLPIVCVGETLEERQSGRTQAVIAAQFEGSLSALTDAQISRVVIAYEPVWAIGTGVVATAEQAEQVHADLRRLIASRYNAKVADGVRIQYGGSVKPDNAAELLGQPNIDGALVGGASLKADSFWGIAAASHGTR